MSSEHRLFLVGLEPLQERYTGAWARWLPETFSKRFEVHNVEGEPLAGVIRTGAFLDLNSTVHYKASQLQKLACAFDTPDLIRNGDVIWFSDIEWWGMEAARYMADLSGRQVVIAGFLHAASHTHGDFMEPMADVGRYAELAWVRACDVVCVGTEYARRAFLGRRVLYAGLQEAEIEAFKERLVVTGNPFRPAEIRELAASQGPAFARDIDILFPHRLDAEKNPGTFLACVEAWAARGLKVALTTGRKELRSTNAEHLVQQARALANAGKLDIYTDCTPERFYKLLSRAKVTVSCATEESFGYAMVEAAALGSIPVVPEIASYLETLATAVYYSPRALLKQDQDGAVKGLRRAVDQGLTYAASSGTVLMVQKEADQLGRAENLILHHLVDASRRVRA